jgi:hypothetical protein
MTRRNDWPMHEATASAVQRIAVQRTSSGTKAENRTADRELEWPTLEAPRIVTRSLASRIPETPPIDPEVD